jgi:hypothetical protein
MAAKYGKSANPLMGGDNSGMKNTKGKAGYGPGYAQKSYKGDNPTSKGKMSKNENENPCKKG